MFLSTTKMADARAPCSGLTAVLGDDDGAGTSDAIADPSTSVVDTQRPGRASQAHKTSAGLHDGPCDEPPSRRSLAGAIDENQPRELLAGCGRPYEREQVPEEKTKRQRQDKRRHPDWVCVQRVDHALQRWPHAARDDDEPQAEPADHGDPRAVDGGSNELPKDTRYLELDRRRPGDAG